MKVVEPRLMVSTVSRDLICYCTLTNSFTTTITCNFLHICIALFHGAQVNSVQITMGFGSRFIPSHVSFQFPTVLVSACCNFPLKQSTSVVQLLIQMWPCYTTHRHWMAIQPWLKMLIHRSLVMVKSLQSVDKGVDEIYLVSEAYHSLIMSQVRVVRDSPSQGE